MSGANEIWNSLGQFQDEIIAIPFALLTAYLIYLFRPKVKVIWGQANNSFHVIKPTPNEENPTPVDVSVYTEKMFIQNIGKAAATEIEIVYSQEPNEFSIFPDRSFNEEKNPSGNFIIKVPSLAPKELIIIDAILISGNPAKILSVNCKEAVTKKVLFLVQRQFGKTFTAFIAALMLGGLIFFISIFLQLLL